MVAGTGSDGSGSQSEAPVDDASLDAVHVLEHILPRVVVIERDLWNTVCNEPVDPERRARFNHLMIEISDRLTNAADALAPPRRRQLSHRGPSSNS